MPPKRKKTIPRPVHFETTIPVIRPCSRCGVWLAAGVAEGLKAEIEFTVLDMGQQIWAIVQGIDLYCLRRSGLVYMDASRLADPPGAIYPQHRCDIAWPKVLGEVKLIQKPTVPPY